MKTKLGKTLVSKDGRTGSDASIRAIRRLAQVKRKRLQREKYLKDMRRNFNEWTVLRPRMNAIQNSLMGLLKEAENIVMALDEPFYIIEMPNTNEVLVCKGSDLKRVN